MITDADWYSNEGSFVVLARFPDEDFLIADFDQSNRPDDEVIDNIALTVAAPKLLKLAEQYKGDVVMRISVLENEWDEADNTRQHDEGCIAEYEKLIAHWATTLEGIETTLKLIKNK